MDLPALEMDHKRMLEARFIGYAFVDMTEKELGICTTGLILKISVICGCQLPTGDAHINILESEFIKFLSNAGYETMTMEEVLTAFRFNAEYKLLNKVETYGAVFNIDYAGKVLHQYCQMRLQLDSKFKEHDRVRHEEKIYKEEEDRRRMKVRSAFEKYKENPESKIDYSDCYMQLNEDGAFLDKNASYLFRAEAEDALSKSIESGNVSLAAHLKRFGDNMELNFLSGKIATKYLFKQLVATGKSEIYSEDLKLSHYNFEIPDEIRGRLPKSLDF